MSWFVDAIRNKYATFGGRAHRTEYWMFTLMIVIIALVLAMIDGIIGKQILSTVFSLATLLPSLAVGARRLHDTNRTGWWLLIGIVPLVGVIVLIVFLVQDSQPGSNPYGANPKGAA